MSHTFSIHETKDRARHIKEEVESHLGDEQMQAFKKVLSAQVLDDVLITLIVASLGIRTAYHPWIHSQGDETYYRVFPHI